MSTKNISTGRRGLLALGLVVAGALACGLALRAPRALARSISAQPQVSQNWSGYVVHSSAGRQFSSVAGSWIQPALGSATSGDGYSAFWVGLGGASQGSQALEQVGTSAQVVGGQTTYSAWYELVPAAQVTLPLAMHPGDHISGRVTVNGTSVTVYLADQSTGQSVTRTLQMTGPDTSSAEWIAEAPAAVLGDGSTQVLPLADFGSVTFTNASATADGHSGPIGDPAWTVDRVDLNPGSTGSFTDATLGQQSSGGASTGGVSADGSSFKVSYESQAASPPAAYPSSGYPGYAYPGYGDPGAGYGDPGITVYVYVP